jgi:uncharacterized membrane protein YphA (DoxX/SURF4 family)
MGVSAGNLWALSETVWESAFCAVRSLVTMGFLSSPACVALLIDMIVATLTSALSTVPKGLSPLNWLDDFLDLPEVLYVLFFFWLICSGPGKFSVDYWLAGKLLRWLMKQLVHRALQTHCLAHWSKSIPVFWTLATQNLGRCTELKGSMGRPGNGKRKGQIITER